MKKADKIGMNFAADLLRAAFVAGFTSKPRARNPNAKDSPVGGLWQLGRVLREHYQRPYAVVTNPRPKRRKRM